MEGRLHLKYFNNLLWSHKSKFQIWKQSDQWLLSYNPFARRVGGISRSRLCTLDRFYNHSFGHPIDRMGLSSGPSVAIFILSVHEHMFVYNISEAELEKVEYSGS